MKEIDISTHCFNVSGLCDQILVSYYTVKFSDWNHGLWCKTQHLCGFMKEVANF